MGYGAWFEAHGQKHHAIASRLKAEGFSTAEIIDYFDFENMVTAEPEFCELYATKTKCHDMKKLNCYLCACPHFRFDDNAQPESDGKTRYSSCSIDSKEGATAQYGDTLHHDCSGCTVPHHRNYIEKNFALEWFDIMKACDTTTKN